jgi:hypothetical protein
MSTDQTLLNPSDTRGRRGRRMGFLAVLFVTLFSALVGLASPAGATTYVSGNHYGGTLCDGWRYVDNAGAEGCVNRGARSLNYWIDLQNIAYDYAADGKSARSFVTIQQNAGGVWRDTNYLTTATSSNGYGWNYVAPAQRLYKVNGATHFRLVIQACTWDKPTNSYWSCATRALTATSWSA